jgi:hypothetical protein
MTRNPLEKYRAPRERDPKRPLISEETVNCLINVALNVHRFLPLLIILARHTGRRLSAILGLRWDTLTDTLGANSESATPAKPISRFQLPLLGSNQDSPDPESGVLPVTPRGSIELSVELRGIEPLTSALRTRRSPS